MLGFVAFNFFFLPPYETFAIAKAHDVIVLFVFLGLSVLISVLVARADARARAAEARAEELRRQQDLSRLLVEPQPGPRPYEGVLRVVVATFGFLDGALYVQEGPDRGLVEQATVGGEPGAVPPTGGDGVERLPLNVGRRNLGLLVMRGVREPLSAVGAPHPRVVRQPARPAARTRPGPARGRRASTGGPDSLDAARRRRSCRSARRPACPPRRRRRAALRSTGPLASASTSSPAASTVSGCGITT